MWYSRNKVTLFASLKQKSVDSLPFIRFQRGIDTTLCCFSLTKTKPLFCSAFYSKVKSGFSRLKDQSYVSPFVSSKRLKRATTKSFSLSNKKYLVYTKQTRKRIAYLVIGFICVFICAYRHRIALIYSITQALHSSLYLCSDHINSRSCKDKDTSHFLPLYRSTPSENESSNFLCLENNEIGSLESSKRVTLDYLPLLNQSDKDLVEKNPIESLSSLFFDIQKPLKVDLVFTDVEEAFSTSLSVCLFYSFLFAVPLLLYHILCFFLPAMTSSQKDEFYSYIAVFIGAWYLLLWFVDSSLIPQFCSFLYSFQIKTSSLSLRAETKIYSYVSWFIYVNVLFSVVFLLCSIFFEIRKRKIEQSIEFSFCKENQQTNKRDKKRLIENKDRKRAKQTINRRCAPCPPSNSYKPRRGNTWCLCLLVSALISPPETYMQLACTLVMIVCNEFILGISLVRAYRSALSKQHQSRSMPIEEEQ